MILYLSIMYFDALYLLGQYIMGKPVNKLTSPVTQLIADNEVMRALLFLNKDESFFCDKPPAQIAILFLCWIMLLVPIKVINLVGICTIVFVYIIFIIIHICKFIVFIRERNIKKCKNQKEAKNEKIGIIQ